MLGRMRHYGKRILSIFVCISSFGVFNSFLGKEGEIMEGLWRRVLGGPSDWFWGRKFLILSKKDNTQSLGGFGSGVSGVGERKGKQKKSRRAGFGAYCPVFKFLIFFISFVTGAPLPYLQCFHRFEVQAARSVLTGLLYLAPFIFRFVVNSGCDITSRPIVRAILDQKLRWPSSGSTTKYHFQEPRTFPSSVSYVCIIQPYNAAAGVEWAGNSGRAGRPFILFPVVLFCLRRFRFRSCGGF
ncbi:hypothetical protein QBC43DRAFT_326052 [Cladorrhinum sp. PSN259]|nr:hypothetical protein QBC43DRAFT_326052 [Cladorrhinum sp. PSN259]